MSENISQFQIREVQLDYRDDEGRLLTPKEVCFKFLFVVFYLEVEGANPGAGFFFQTAIFCNDHLSSFFFSLLFIKEFSLA